MACHLRRTLTSAYYVTRLVLSDRRQPAQAGALRPSVTLRPLSTDNPRDSSMPSRCAIPVLYVIASLAVAMPATGLRADVDPARAMAAARAAPVIADDLPLRIESSSVDGKVEGRVHGHLAFPFATVSSTLRDPAAWCAIIVLHQNVKACVYVERADAEVLRVYNGKKHFQDAENAIVSEYVFTPDASDPSRMVISLTAATGPLGTSDHRIVLDARADPGGGTAIEFRYHYQVSQLAQTSLRIYLATSGRDKIGFTVIGENAQGEPQHVTGVRGLIERNAVRYYLAITAYLESHNIPMPSASEWRAGRWYDLTQAYAAQLHEVERADYLANKRREFAQQAVLQAQAADRVDSAREH